jgi:hypothetical protein
MGKKISIGKEMELFGSVAYAATLEAIVIRGEKKESRTRSL